MQNPYIPGGYWSKQFPCYTVRMEQMNKMFRVMNCQGQALNILSCGLSLVPKV